MFDFGQIHLKQNKFTATKVIKISFVAVNFGNRLSKSAKKTQNQNALTISINDSDFSEAPPIRPPSTFGFANSCAAFDGLQLPP